MYSLLDDMLSGREERCADYSKRYHMQDSVSQCSNTANRAKKNPQQRAVNNNHVEMSSIRAPMTSPIPP